MGLYSEAVLGGGCLLGGLHVLVDCQNVVDGAEISILELSAFLRYPSKKLPPPSFAAQLTGTEGQPIFENTKVLSVGILYLCLSLCVSLTCLFLAYSLEMRTIVQFII